MKPEPTGAGRHHDHTPGFISWHQPGASLILIFIRDRVPIVSTASNDRIYEISTFVSPATPSNPPSESELPHDRTAVWFYCAFKSLRFFTVGLGSAYPQSL